MRAGLTDEALLPKLKKLIHSIGFYFGVSNLQLCPFLVLLCTDRWPISISYQIGLRFLVIYSIILYIVTT